MLDYAAHRPAAAKPHSSPNTMLSIIAVHVAAIAAVMSARMDLPAKPRDPPIKMIDVPKPRSPEHMRPVEQPKTRPMPAPGPTLPDPFVSIPADTVIPADPTPPLPLPFDNAPGAGSGGDSVRPIPATPAILLTGAGELKPPYPASKLASGEEAVLKLRLTISDTGRVSAVEAIGRADPAFLASAQRHILAHWRYRPASRDGRGVATTLVISLRFELEE